MRISKTLTDNLRRLLAGERVAASTLRKDMAETLLSEGLLTVQAHGSRRSYRAINTTALKNYLQTQYEEWRMLNDEGVQFCETRSEQAAETGNSKLVKVSSCPGFPVNSYEPIECVLNGRPFVVNPPEGCFVFIADWQQFTIPKDVVVVGIENMENFRMIRRQRQLFASLIGGKRLLFVSRYPQSTHLRRWLQPIPNPYVHFGDFDLAGIHIFLSEFQQYLDRRASFLIPPDIEQRLSKGSPTRYNEQYSKFKTLRSDTPSLQSLIDLINKYHRGYDQEGYITDGWVMTEAGTDRAHETDPKDDIINNEQYDSQGNI